MSCAKKQRIKKYNKKQQLETPHPARFLAFFVRLLLNQTKKQHVLFEKIQPAYLAKHNITVQTPRNGAARIGI